MFLHSRRLPLDRFLALLVTCIMAPIPVGAWVASEDGALLQNYGGDSFIVDATGNAISVGWLGLSPTWDLFILKKGAALGQEHWRYQATTGCTGKAMGAVAIDSQGNILAAGGCRDNNSMRIAFLVKLDPGDGHEIWRIELANTTLVSVTTDSADNPIAVGIQFGATLDLFAIKVNARDGGEVWRAVINGAADLDDVGASVAVNKQDDVLVSGNLHDRPAFSHPDFAILKLSGINGVELWRFTIDSISAHGGNAEKVVVDSNGDIIAGGQAVLIDWCDLLVVKVDSDGAEIWRSVFDDPTAVGSCDAANTIALDPNDNVLVAAKPRTTVYSVIKYSSSTGAELWRTDVPNVCACTGGNCAGANGVVSDAAGNVFVTGKLSGCSDLTTLKLDGTTGSQVWRDDLDLGCADAGHAIAIDSFGEVVIGGSGFVQVDGACAWPAGGKHVIQKLSGSSGADFVGELPTPTATPTPTPTATPTPTPVVQSNEQQKCINLMNRASVNVGKTQGRESSRCVKFATRDATDKLGIPPQTQTAQACLTNDVTGKVQRKLGILAKRDAVKCLAEPQQLPNFGYAGTLEAGTSVMVESSALTAELFGPDLDGALVLKDQDEAGAKCQEVAHRSIHGLFDAVTKEVERGVYQSLRGGNAPQGDSGAMLSAAARDFIDDDGRDKIARAEQRAADKIGRVCPGDLASLFPGICSGRAGTASDLAQCLNEAARCRGCKAAEGFGALTLDCEEFDNGLADSSCQ